MSLYVGIPTYDGKLHGATVGGIAQLGLICGKNGIGLAIDIIPHDAFIGRARALIAKRFMESGFNDLLYVDADIGFDAEAAAIVCQSPAEIVMGLYRMKEDGPNETQKVKFPALLSDPLERNPEDPSLIGIEYGPAGFMRVRRTVFEKMQEKWPDDWFEDANGRLYDYFPAGRQGNAFWGEDIAFCMRAKECGFKLWAAQGIELHHYGEKKWPAKWQIDVPAELKEAA